MAIVIKTPEQIEKMRAAGRNAAQVLDFISNRIKITFFHDPYIHTIARFFEKTFEKEQ